MKLTQQQFFRPRADPPNPNVLLGELARGNVEALRQLKNMWGSLGTVQQTCVDIEEYRLATEKTH